MASPQRHQRGDLLLRGTLDTGFQLIDPVTHQAISGELVTLADVVATARRLGATGICHDTSTAQADDAQRRTERMLMDE